MTDDRAPVKAANAHPREADDDEEMPKMGITRERAVLFGLFVVSAIAFLYFVLPQLGDVKDTWGKLDDGDPYWLAVAFGLQLLATASYIAVFQGVHVPPGYPIRFRESYQITMAGLAATRLFAAGGAGGVALTAWALRRSGMPRREVAERMIAFLVLTYLVYTLSIVIFGYGLRLGIFPGENPFGLTVVPATIALAVTVIGLSIGFVPTDIQRRLDSFAERGGRIGRLAQRLASAPASASAGIRIALGHIRAHDPAILGAIGFWGFQIACLWACFRAFGDAPPFGVLVLAFFLGQLGNLLPLPGGIGGVDGGLIGAYAAFGVDAGLAVVAVLVYRGFTFWLPTVPGILAYIGLRKTVERWRVEGRPALSYTK
jgi:putative heme transporter